MCLPVHIDMRVYLFVVADAHRQAITISINMESDKKYLCLNILGFKNAAVSAEEYYDYMVNVHAPHVGGLLAKYGIVHRTMVCIASFLSTSFSFSPGFRK
jgi:hypothetical protein